MPESVRIIRNKVKIRIPGSTKIGPWLKKVAKNEGRSIHDLTFILSSDPYLLKMNREFLGHDYYTDVITFDLSDGPGPVFGEVYISVDRVKENSTALGLGFTEELFRVMVHGLLHLLGYSDKTSAQKQAMRLKEDACLSLLARSTWNEKRAK